MASKNWSVIDYPSLRTDSYSILCLVFRIIVFLSCGHHGHDMTQ